MQRYLIKRLALFPLSIWVISSIVFIISRAVPGSYADLAAGEEQISAGRTHSVVTRTSHLQKLEASGQDKPLFYFSVLTRSEPDTLQRVSPVQHQQFLKKLIRQFGHWPAIAAYYKSLENLKRVAQSTSTNNTGRSLVSEQVNKLYASASSQQINLALRNLSKITGSAPDTELAKAIKKTQTTYKSLITQARPINQVLPNCRWNGLHNQYHLWLTQMMKGEFGKSYRDGHPVTSIIAEAVGNSMFLLLGSLLIVFAMAIQLSLLLSVKAYTRLRQIVLPVLYVLDSVPLFILALLLLTFLAGSGYLNLFPVFGLGDISVDESDFFSGFLSRLHHLVLPVICLVLGSLPYITTQLFQVMQQVKMNEFITTAKAKGLSESFILKRHVFRNAQLPLITLFTGYLPALISGALVLEVIFAIPGTGRLLVDSILARDYPVVLGLVILIAAFKVGANLLADFLYFTADPRTRLAIE